MSYKVGIIGASGYTGYELIRLVANHPLVCLHAVTSRKHTGKRVSDIFHGLSCNLEFCDPNDNALNQCDIVFSALPQTAGIETVGKLIDKGIRVIDLSADFRFTNTATYENVYAVTHTRKDLAKIAVYGLCEHNREQIKSARLVANPGCFVTSALLPLLPLHNKKLLSRRIIIDSASGVSGAGRKSDEAYSFCETSDNFKAYGVFTHRHTNEIAEKLGDASVIFTPHLLPVKRGIISTVYLTDIDAKAVTDVLQAAYANEYFVSYSTELPELKFVTGTNRCLFSVRTKGNDAIIVSAIDNLLKGAAGQAVQNMNIMLGIDERLALEVNAPV